ncbi:MAG: sigma-70 family RNA polymerase sigma factor [Deltaproteobacteria bacterium]|nr:sigma-70 family RNA polymerase sigma factor [Deltaproteobacteria bacterium]
MLSSRLVAETSPSDYELLAAWRDGDDGAGNILVQRHVATLYRFFANKVNEGMEDLAQRTLLACVEARERVDPSRSFRAYLLGIARNLLMRHYRHAVRDARADRLQKASVDELVGSPSRDLAVKQERKLLLRALRQLPVDAQVVLELFYWEAMTIAEISAVLESPEGTIKSRLSRGKAVLRDKIAELATDAAVRDTTLTELEDWARSLRDLALPD